ncbi:MAG: SpoIIE family protein phosphatase [Candidatus Marinimicrobia bacterium]|nr:SpoIIE family protein phosphatase [Candidatus Neomarinimicrobiota bacterium]MCF7921486.1 SpoIIE family protein phosphatase [Candidatus Neomarinimicrobiota bacterium]
MLRREELLVSLVLIIIISVLGYLINQFLGFGEHPILANVVFATIIINLYRPLRSRGRKLVLRLIASSYYERNENFRNLLDELENVSTYREMLDLVPRSMKQLFESDIVALFVRRKGIFKIESSIAPKPILLDGITLNSEHEILKKLMDTEHHLLNVKYSVNDLNTEHLNVPPMDYRSFKLFQWAIPLKANNRLAGFILLDKMPLDMQARRSGTLYNFVVDQIAVLLEKRKLYHRIQLEARKQEALTLIASKMAATRNTTRIFNLLLDEVNTIVPYDACGVFLASTEGINIEKFLQRGYDTRRLNPLKLKIGRGIVGRCIATQKPISIPDVQREKDYLPGRADSRSELCVPIAGGSNIYGAMNLESNRVGAFSEDDLDFLQTIAMQAGVLMERYKIDRHVNMQSGLSEDMAKAEHIQKSMLPTSIPEHDEVTFDLRYIPCRQISGDFYDISSKTEDVFNIGIGDVVGKGISGALIMSNFYAAYLNETQKGFPIATLMTNLNKYLTNETELDEQITFFLSKMDVDKGIIYYVNAGHPAPLVFHHDGSIERMESGGPLLGFDPDFTYEMGEVKLQNGDLFLLYTDGVTETVGSAGQILDESGLIAAVQAHLDEHVSVLANRLLEKIEKFNRKSSFEDDVTFIVGRYSGIPAEMVENMAGE